MRRADRLFQIVQYLRGGRLTTAARLAERLEVSERTIYRDIVDLQASGVPVEGASGYGYVMADGYDLPPLMFTRDEIVALTAGARIVRAWGGAAMARAAEEALEKIRAVLSPDAQQRSRAIAVHAIPIIGPDAATRALLDELERAAEERVRLLLRYADAEGRETDRPVRPLGLWFWGKVWTLIAWCELRDDFRMFRVDRIAAARPEGRFRHEDGKRLTDFYRREAPPGSEL
jgi:predicted DNA-binding transcriptional regulator YafY